MPRTTGNYRNSTVGGETVRAFVPAALPPAGPSLRVEGPIDAACGRAMAAVGRLEVAANLVPSTEWFLYGFVRKEAVLTSQIEARPSGTRASTAVAASISPRRTTTQTRCVSTNDKVGNLHNSTQVSSIACARSCPTCLSRASTAFEFATKSSSSAG